MDLKTYSCFFWAVLLVLGQGCGSRELSKEPAEVFPANFAAIRQKILIPKCLSCHAKLASYKAVTEELVVAGDPAESELYTETESGEMPLNSPPLDDPELDAIKKWIEKGAPND